MNVQADFQNPRAFDEANEQAWPGQQFVEVTFTHLLLVVQVRRKVILATAAVLFALACVVLFMITPRYTGTSLVMIDDQQSKVVDIEAVVSGLSTNDTDVENQTQILKSTALAQRVVDRLKLVQDSEFNAALQPSAISIVLSYLPSWLHKAVADPEKTDEAVVSKFLSLLTVTAQGHSSVIEIDFQSEDPQKAKRIANAIGDAYVDGQIEAKFMATQKATQWLADHLNQLGQQVRLANMTVAQYEAENNLTDTGKGISVVDQQTADLNSQLTLARADRAEAHAKLDRMNQLVSSGQSANDPEVVASPLISTLRSQESDLIRQRADLASHYGPLHPKILDIDAQKREVENKINTEIGHIVEFVRNQSTVADARVASLQSSLSGLMGEFSTQNRARVKLTELQANAASVQALYDTFAARLKQTQEQQNLQIPDARIISPSPVPIKPSYPRTSLILAAAVPASLVLGLLIGFLLEYLDNGFRTVTDVEQQLKLPVLATIPNIPSTNVAQVAATVLTKPLSAYAEAMRGIQIGLKSVDDAGKVLLVTSAVPGEGKTTLSVSYARQAALSGKKVIVVDGDLRNPSVAGVFGLKNVEYGFDSLLSGQATLEQVLVQDSKSSVVILPGASGSSRNAPELVRSLALETTIMQLRKAFDLVVIDSAPMLVVNDTKIVANLCDSILFAVLWERTPREAAKEAIKWLREGTETPIAGVAITRVNASRFSYYSYGNYRQSDYAKYYNEA